MSDYLTRSDTVEDGNKVVYPRIYKGTQAFQFPFFLQHSFMANVSSEGAWSCDVIMRLAWKATER